MAQKRGQRGGASSDDPEELSRVPLQAVLLADSFAVKFRPITQERPKMLLPLVNVPMIEYTLAWLESVGVEEVFVFCCAHASQVKDYLKKSEWMKPTAAFSITTIESHDATSAGDALRAIYSHGVIRGDFVLVSGDTVSNMSLAQAIQEHKERKKKDPLAIMTMIVQHSKPSTVTHQTRLGNDEVVMAIDPVTKELLYYEDKADHSKSRICIDKMLLTSNTALHLHTDKEDCYVDICSQEVLSLFTDNFDYQQLRRHFVKGLLVDDIMGYKIFTHEIHSSYAARIDNFRSYTISKDILQRWTYPLVPNVQYFHNSSLMKLDREGVYKAPDVVQSRSAQVSAFTLIGSGTSIGDHSVIRNSVVGQGCTIGRNVSINGSYIWDNVIIEDDCKLDHALVCDGVHLRAGVVLEPGVILSFKVEVGQQNIVPAYSKVSLFPQPSIEDSDEELEYADSISGAIESPSFTSVSGARNMDLIPDHSEIRDSGISEVGIAGVGYLWSTSEGGHEEDWRHSIAPIPAERLKELAIAFGNENECDLSNQDVNGTQISGEIHPKPDDASSDDDDDENGDFADFEKEVEATFQRALTGVDQENVILEINSLRMSYNMSHADCAGALFYSIVKSATVVPYTSNNELRQNCAKEIVKWKDLLRNYLISVDEEIEVILKFEEMCLDTTKELSPMFSLILNYLYENDILSEEAILSWAAEKEGADDEDKKFVKQSEQFITWLKEASEEEDEDD